MSDVKKLFDLTGKVAIVTGALGLIGKHHCYALSEAGANVVVADLNESDCESFAKSLPTKSVGVEVNIVDRKSVENLRDKTLKEFGQIDILVNNAAINDMFENPQAAAELSMFENYPLDMWQKSLDVNVTGTFLCSQIIGKVMADQGSGSIINIASTYGMVGPDQSIYKKPDGTQLFYKSPAYPVTKGAIINFTRFLAAYWGNKGVRVNTLSPGGVENNQDEYFVKNYSVKTMLGRMAAPTDYKGAIVFLASDASAYMTGANLVVDGGWTAW
ncbi:MAG: SDR family oxidoreductase [Ignavibacterium album]|jgi:NAD(P)-dependent dehydrogenase (short-subunit alcohol dehydrogenase family)|uniref:SDR family oxidoreductase n=1 Tax=Ignavibacterium album TaxID=591197 RepID=UPI0026EA6142|nr:SDR family oxidoreductase [Ignavibacterium album]MCX8105397.1 SDR family oxidoreductase [Ignavibacterium album]